MKTAKTFQKRIELRRILRKNGIKSIMLINEFGEKYYYLSSIGEQDENFYNLMSMYVAAISQVGIQATGRDASKALITTEGGINDIYILKRNEFITFIVYNSATIAPEDLDEIASILLEYSRILIDTLNQNKELFDYDVIAREIDHYLLSTIKDLEKYLTLRDESTSTLSRGFAFKSNESGDNYTKIFMDTDQMMQDLVALSSTSPLEIFLDNIERMKLKTFFQLSSSLNFLIVDDFLNVVFSQINNNLKPNVIDFIITAILNSFECMQCTNDQCVRRIKSHMKTAKNGEMYYLMKIEDYIVMFQEIRNSFTLVAFTTKYYEKILPILEERFTTLIHYLKKIISMKEKEQQKSMPVR